MELTGKNVIITGGARGMGKKFAVDLKNLRRKALCRGRSPGEP